LICSSAGVEAIRAGIMKGTLLDGFPSASSTGPKRSASSRVKVLPSSGGDLPGMRHEELGKRTEQATAVARRQQRKRFYAFSADATFHAAWTQSGGKPSRNPAVQRTPDLMLTHQLCCLFG
jgi:hypothetical protein